MTQCVSSIPEPSHMLPELPRKLDLATGLGRCKFNPRSPSESERLGLPALLYRLLTDDGTTDGTSEGLRR